MRFPVVEARIPTMTTTDRHEQLTVPNEKQTMTRHKEPAHPPFRPVLRLVAAALFLAANHEVTASIANAKEPQGTRQGAPKDSTSSAGVRKSAPNKWSFKNVGKGTPPIMSQESAVAWCASGGMLLPTLELAEHQI